MSQILDCVITLLETPLHDIPMNLIPLGENFSAELSKIRGDWYEKSKTPEELTEVQKIFSEKSVALTSEMLTSAVKLLGPPPGEFALLLMGSSSRNDRLPYSDIELALLYSAVPEKMVEMRVYLYMVMSIFDFLVAKLQENYPDHHGYYIDPSEHLLIDPNTIIGTVDEIYRRNIEIPWITAPGFLVVFDDNELRPEIFTSLLSTTLVNPLYGGSGLFSQFTSKVRHLLDSKSDRWTQENLSRAFYSGEAERDESRVFQVSLGAPNAKEIKFKNLLNRHLIALYCWMGVLRNAIDSPIRNSEIYSVKDNLHKPLAYLAFTLCLFLDTKAVCATEIFDEACKMGILPFPVMKLLQQFYFFSVSWRSKLHLRKRAQQEEVFLSDISDKKWVFLNFVKVIQKPLLEALEEALNEKSSRNFIFRDIFSSIWSNYCELRDKWREESRNHLLITELSDFPSHDGQRPSIAAAEVRKWKTLDAFLLRKRDVPEGSFPRLEVRYVSERKSQVQRMLHPKAVQCLLDNEFMNERGELIFKDKQVKKEKGRHLVMAVSLVDVLKDSDDEIAKTIWIKVYPECPLLEIVATEFANLLVGPNFLPWICLAKIVIGNKAYPAILSEGIPGSLVTKDHPPSLDRHLFSYRVLLALFLNQEDAKPANLIAKPGLENPENFILVSIDNDRSFYDAMTVNEATNSVTPQVKDITFCFDEMLLPISARVRDIFLTIDPHAFLSRWLSVSDKETFGLEDKLLFLESEKEKCRPLTGFSRSASRVSKKLTRNAVTEESVLALVLPDGLVSILYSKMMKLRQFLIKFPRATHLEMLGVVEPHLSKYYQKILNFRGVPCDRFHFGFGALYGEKQKEVTATKTRTLESIVRKVPTTATGEHIKKCVQELEEVHQSEKKWRDVLESLCSNKFAAALESFRKLAPYFQERVIKNLDFSQILKRFSEVELLQVLASKLEFRNIRFRNSESLTDDMLERILKQGRQLQGLSIVNCQSLTPKIFVFLPQCENLEKFYLSHMTWSTIPVTELKTLPKPFWKFHIPNSPTRNNPSISLRVIVLKNLSELQTLALPFTGLECLQIFDCPNLIEILPQHAGSLQSVKLSKCPGLCVVRLFKFLTTCNNLEKLELPDLETLQYLGKVWERSNDQFPEFVSRLKLLPAFTRLKKCEKKELLDLYFQISAS
jgi:hypothetical protein